MICYLDNSATTRQYDEVTDKMAEMARDFYGNPSSLHRLGIKAEDKVKEARNNIAKSLKCDSSEIFFTACGTESDNTVFNAILGVKRNAGKRIIISEVEHPAILEPAKKLEEMGFDVVRIGVDDKCRLDLEALKNAVNEDTVLISIMAVNNEAGTIMPVKEIAEFKDEYNKAHGTNILFHTDAVQALSKINIDLRSELSGVDLLSASAHKIHGPKGMGILYVRNGVNIKPFMLGGGQERGFRSGTENTAGIVGFGEAARISTLKFDERVKKMTEARKRLLDGILAIPDVKINSVIETGMTSNLGCPSVLNASFMGTRGEVILHDLEQNGIYVSTGSACSSNHSNSKGSHVLNAMGLKPKEIESALRFSFSEENTLEEIDYTLDKLEGAVKRFRRLGQFR